MSLLFVGSAGAQSILEYSNLWTGPNEFYLGEWVSDQTFSFEEMRPVRVCVSDPEEAQTPTSAAMGDPADVALNVEHDSGEKMMIQPGECAEFQAQRVTVSPAEAIESGWTLHGTIETREPQSNS